VRLDVVRAFVAQLAVPPLAVWVRATAVQSGAPFKVKLTVPVGATVIVVMRRVAVKVTGESTVTAGAEELSDSVAVCELTVCVRVGGEVRVKLESPP
jgi:hypothetical protein